MQANDRAQTMSEQSSPTSPTASAFYDPDSSSWRMCQASFPLDLDEEADWTLLQRLPDWIMWDGQALSEQATPERLIAVRDGSASPNLPTPTVNNAKESGTIRDWKGDLTAALLLTPRAQMLVIKPWIRPLDQPQNLENAIGRLLPTPTARDYKDTGDLKKSVPDDDSLLPRAIAHHVISDPSPKQSDDGNESSDDPPPTPSTTGETCRPCSSSG